MRKRITGAPQDARGCESAERWLNLEQIATIEVTSEHPGFPIESAFCLQEGPGWRASEKGEQQIRIIFDEPVSLQQIYLRFHEAESERTQEFTLRWSSAAGAPTREIVRQQWNFSPAGSTTEVENYAVELAAVAVLELVIQPDLSGRQSIATLASWCLG
jgi:uncharacterized protein (DUF736 family)